MLWACPLGCWIRKLGEGIDVALTKRITESTLPRWVRSYRRHLVSRRILRTALVVSLAALMSYLILWLGSHLYDYQTRYYEPRDIEREGR